MYSCRQRSISALAEATIAIEIDIEPGTADDAINPTREVEIPVTILGSDTFDVSAADGTALRFAAGEATPSHDLGDPEVFADHLADVNGDGFADLVSHYSALQSGILSGDTTACLGGSTLEGTPIEGCDAIHLNTRKRGRRR